MDDTKPKINPLMVPYMLWGGLTLSQLFYILVGYAIAQPAKEPVESSLVMVLTGMALFNLGLSVFIRHWLTQPKQLKAQQDPPEVLMEKAFPLPINGLIITWAVAESCALWLHPDATVRRDSVCRRPEPGQSSPCSSSTAHDAFASTDSASRND